MFVASLTLSIGAATTREIDLQYSTLCSTVSAFVTLNPNTIENLWAIKTKLNHSILLMKINFTQQSKNILKINRFNAGKMSSALVNEGHFKILFNWVELIDSLLTGKINRL